MGEPHHDVCLPFFGAFCLPPLFSAPPLGCVCFFRSHLPIELPMMNSHIYIYHIHSEYSAALFRHVLLRDEPFLFASEMARCGALKRFDTDLLQSEQLEVIVADPTRCMDDEFSQNSKCDRSRSNSWMMSIIALACMYTR